MTWLNADFSVDDALARGHAAWDLLINNWGNESAPSADGTSLEFPALNTRSLPAPATIAIGPRSLVDRAIVRWDIQKILPDNTSWDYYRRLSVGAPLNFWQPANRRNNGAGGNAGSVAILTEGRLALPPTNDGGNLAADSIRFGALYAKADGTQVTFAADSGVSGNAPKFVSPLLHLVYYFQAPGQIPVERYPFFYQRSIRGDALGTGAEQLCVQLPVFGRKRVRITMRSTTDALSYRAGVLDQLASASIVPVERTIWAAPGVPINVPASADVVLSGADYLMIYMTGGVGDLDIRTNITVTASD